MLNRNNKTLYFIGIGAPKCGTTQVADWIDAHPELCLSVPKEVLYFNRKVSYIHGDNENFSKSLDWYQKHFAHCALDQKIGEFSASYIYSKEAAEKIHSLYPNIKIIVCLRQPVDRSYSQYLMFKHYLKKEDRPFYKAINEEPELLERSKYAGFIKTYLDLFPRKNFLFLTLDEIVKNPRPTLTRVYDFLDVDVDYVPKDFDINRKKAKSSKSVWVSKAMGLFTNTMTSIGLAKVVVKLKSMGLKDAVMQINSKEVSFEKLNPSFRDELNQEFLKDLEETEKLTGLDLRQWK